MTVALTIVLPTVRGREGWLEKAERWYRENTVVPHEIIVLHDYDGCGPAWQAGGEQARGSYLHMAADDLEPHRGWEQAAIEICDRGLLPAPLIFNPDGSIQSSGGSWGQLELNGEATDFTRAPFMSLEQWELIEPMLPCHYYTDNWVSHQGRKYGFSTVNCHGYRLTHHSAVERRDEGRMGPDQRIFARACAGEDVWHEYSSRARPDSSVGTSHMSSSAGAITSLASTETTATFAGRMSPKI